LCLKGDRMALGIASMTSSVVPLQLTWPQISISSRVVLEVANCDLKQGTTSLSLMPKRSTTLAVPVESRILILRHQRVILDSDLAELYGVTVKRLNQQVNRNQERFPADFVFRLTVKEDQILRFQIATSSKQHGGRRYPPYAFTEHGAIMAATVLNSKRAIEMSVFVVRAFVRMREMLIKNRQLAAKIDELDRRLETHDTAIQDLIDAIKELMIPEGTPRRKIGFHASTRQVVMVAVLQFL
jgi:phage regulator Rha-like protein